MDFQLKVKAITDTKRETYDAEDLLSMLQDLLNNLDKGEDSLEIDFMEDDEENDDE